MQIVIKGYPIRVHASGLTGKKNLEDDLKEGIKKELERELDVRVTSVTVRLDPKDVSTLHGR